MSVPDYVNIIARYEEGVGIDLLELQVHGVPPDRGPQEIPVSVVGKGDLKKNHVFNVLS